MRTALRYSNRQSEKWPDRHNPILRYYSRDVKLQVYTSYDSDGQDLMMTWGTWSHALIGLGVFAKAYEGLDFYFHVLEGGDRAFPGYDMGWGRLTTSDEI